MSFWAGFPVVGSFSRTSVNGQAGSRTQLVGGITGTVMMLALYTLTEQFYYLPNCALSAIIIYAVISLIDFVTFWVVLKSDKREFVAMLATFLVTLFVGASEGIYTGVGLSFFLFVQHAAVPRISIIGYRAAGGKYDDIKRFPDAVEEPGIIIVRSALVALPRR